MSRETKQSFVPIPYSRMAFFPQFFVVLYFPTLYCYSLICLVNSSALFTPPESGKKPYAVLDNNCTYIITLAVIQLLLL